jgi:hypothetical protein
MTFASWGRTSVLANVFPRIAEALKLADASGALRDNYLSIIGEVLKGIHEDFIWGKRDSYQRSIGLIIVVAI